MRVDGRELGIRRVPSSKGQAEDGRTGKEHVSIHR